MSLCGSWAQCHPAPREPRLNKRPMTDSIAGHTAQAGSERGRGFWEGSAGRKLWRHGCRAASSAAARRSNGVETERGGARTLKLKAPNHPKLPPSKPPAAQAAASRASRSASDSTRGGITMFLAEVGSTSTGPVLGRKVSGIISGCTGTTFLAMSSGTPSGKTACQPRIEQVRASTRAGRGRRRCVGGAARSRAEARCAGTCSRRACSSLRRRRVRGAWHHARQPCGGAAAAARTDIAVGVLLLKQALDAVAQGLDGLPVRRNRVIVDRHAVRADREAGSGPAATARGCGRSQERRQAARGAVPRAPGKRRRRTAIWGLGACTGQTRSAAPRPWR